MQVFCAAGTQWRLAPGGAPLGLDYQGVLAVMRFLHIRPSADLLVRLRIMESEARGILAREIALTQKRAAQRAGRGRR